jgi:hypothetical protein
MAFKPAQKEHYFRSFGTWLFDVTNVLPNKEETIKRRLQDFSHAELESHMNKHNVQAELPINRQFESLIKVVTEVLQHFKDTGVLDGILLPFEEEVSKLQGSELQSIEDIYLNYGENGQGGQRNPKPRHVLQMLRRWSINRLHAGVARKSPTTGRFFVNEGQQRAIAGCIAGRIRFAYEYIVSDDTMVDLLQFKGENQGKLRASPVEITLSDACAVRKQLEPHCEKKRTNLQDLNYTEIAKVTNLTYKDEEYKNYKIWNELTGKRHFKLVNDENKIEKNSRGACSNLSQIKDIFDTQDYTDEIINDALDLYEMTWSQKRLETADLIGLLEIIYFNQEWLMHKDTDREYVYLKIRNSLRDQWPNKLSGKGSSPAWRQIQEEMKRQFPYVTREEKEKNGYLYSADSSRITKHMWIAQGFYSVLSKRLPKEFADKLVRPTSVHEDLTYDLDIPTVGV